MIAARPEFDEITLYVPGKSLRQARLEGAGQDVVKLASNESLWGPSPTAVEAIRRALSDLALYPETQDPDLIEALASRFQIPPQQILIANGADEIIRLAATAYVRPGDDVLMPAPSFSAYRHSTLLAGGTPRTAPLDPKGRNDLLAILNMIGPRTRIVYLCSPNNPTGAAFSESAFEHYLREVPDGLLTVVDAAYGEFSQQNYTRIPTHGKPVLFVHTFSKLYALAALRIGWASGARSVIEPLLKAREPFSVNALAQVGARASLEDADYFQNVLEETLKSRAFLTSALTRAGLRAYESDANFVTVEVPDGVAERLLADGYVVRDTSGFGLPHHIRITVAPKPILEGFLDALRRVLSGVQ